jgi:hypothetical protein
MQYTIRNTIQYKNKEKKEKKRELFLVTLERLDAYVLR